jgi:hypothetical protein
MRKRENAELEFQALIEAPFHRIEDRSHRIIRALPREQWVAALDLLTPACIKRLHWPHHHLAWVALGLAKLLRKTHPNDAAALMQREAMFTEAHTHEHLKEFMQNFGCGTSDPSAVRLPRAMATRLAEETSLHIYQVDARHRQYVFEGISHRVAVLGGGSFPGMAERYLRNCAKRHKLEFVPADALLALAEVPTMEPN